MLLKSSSKRRRTTQEIKDEKLESEMRAENYEAQAKKIAQLEEKLMQQEIDNETQKEAQLMLNELFRDNKLRMG